MKKPSIHIFNPTSDIAIANTYPSFTPNKHLLRFQSDLAYLPALLAEQDDLVLMPRYDDLEHIAYLYEQGLPSPGQILEEDIFVDNQKVIAEINRFEPWGWAPNIYKKLKQIDNIDCHTFWSFFQEEWTEKIKHFYSRAFALDVLREVLKSPVALKERLYIPENYSPFLSRHLSDIEGFLERYEQLVLKEPWSSSGRGLMFLKRGALPINIKQRVEQVLKKQSYLMIEPLLDKKLDFSLQFDMTKEKPVFKGLTYFFTDKKGQYKGHYLNQRPPLSDKENDFFESHITYLIEDVTRALQSSDLQGKYEGVLGVDALLVHIDGNLYFQPCLEINLRKSMGRIALQLQSLIHPDSVGKYFVYFDPKTSYENFVKQQEVFATKSEGRLLKAWLPLTAPKGKLFGAYMDLKFP